ncbi:MAG: peptidylprolyl isomerase [Proteobacteria bacterium]|nr:peptidylprolyl isomerase [Pseudomonadota bacterium]
MNIIRTAVLTVLIAVTFSLAGCSSKDTGGSTVADTGIDETRLTSLKNTGAVIETKYGEMVVEFFADEAPGHVDNFVKLASDGFYDGTIFHRVIPGFMIQGGDPNTKGQERHTYGQGGPGHNVKAEFNKIGHDRGILSMARSADPDSAGSQFFVVVQKAPHLDGQYTVFGRVTSGLEVMDQIVNLPRDSRDLPDERVEMKIRIVEQND